jgi:hypothetical protein
MSMGNSPADKAPGRYEQLRAKADADRAARLAGHKSFFWRLFGRLRPHRQEPGGNLHSAEGTLDDPGR